MNSYKEYFLYYNVPLVLSFIFLFLTLPSLNVFLQVYAILTYIPEIICILLLVALIFSILSFQKIRERLSFMPFVDFEKNVKRGLNNIHFDTEVKAQYLEINNFKQKGFHNILDIMHKINVLNMNKKDLNLIKKEKRFSLKEWNPKYLIKINFALVLIAIVLFCLFDVKYHPFNLPIGYFTASFGTITILYSIILYIHVLMVGNNEIYIMKTYKKCRDVSNYINLYSNALISKDFIVMAEFAKNIEFVWDKKEREIGLDEFNNEINYLQKIQSEINTLYDEFMSLENVTEETLNEYQQKLYSLTNFSIYEPTE